MKNHFYSLVFESITVNLVGVFYILDVLAYNILAALVSFTMLAFVPLGPDFVYSHVIMVL